VALEPDPATVPLVVVAHDDPGTADALRHAVETAAGFRVAVAQPGPAGLAAALATGPAVALVGCALLAELPAGCRVPLLAVGDDQRPRPPRAAHHRSLTVSGSSVDGLHQTVLCHLVSGPYPLSLAGLMRPGRCLLASRRPGSLTAHRSTAGPDR
jgi:hypothetical protein